MTEQDFAKEIANMAGGAKSVIEQVVDRNPTMPQVARRRLMQAVFRLEALANEEQVRRMAVAAGGLTCPSCSVGTNPGSAGSSERPPGIVRTHSGGVPGRTVSTWHTADTP